MTFARKAYPRQPKPALALNAEPTRAVCRKVDGSARLTVMPKSKPARDKAYLRRVAELACAHCNRPGPSQAAHSDEGKGLSIKASDYETFPLCADGPGRRGCHSLIGSSGTFTREQRRTLERAYVAKTRAALEPARQLQKETT